MNPLHATTNQSAMQQAQNIFNAGWNSIKKPNDIHFPKKILWLNGPPGSGKGTQTQLIKETLNIKPDPIIISDLLKTPEAQKIKDSGLLVNDEEVTKLLLNKLTETTFQNGAIVDGYPRTLPQAQCIKLLFKKLNEIGQPSDFQVLIMDVNESVSIERQLHRGQQAVQGKDIGELRKTDTDFAGAQKRYNVFKEQSYKALMSLKNDFKHHHISANATIAEVQKIIKTKLSDKPSDLTLRA